MVFQTIMGLVCGTISGMCIILATVYDWTYLFGAIFFWIVAIVIGCRRHSKEKKKYYDRFRMRDRLDGGR